MFVKIYIKATKQTVVIPEEWVYGIDEEVLKNRGVNSNQDVRIFWSENGVINGQPDGAFKPNFSLPLCSEFPPTNGEGCYLARQLHYYASFEKASNYCELLRPQLPKIYNERRPNEQPIPSVEPTKTFGTTRTAEAAVEIESDQRTDDLHEQDGDDEVFSDSEQSGQTINETENEQEMFAHAFIIHDEPQVENVGTGEIPAQEEPQFENAGTVEIAAQEEPLVENAGTVEIVAQEEPLVENVGTVEIAAQEEPQQHHELENEFIACDEETDPKFSLPAVDVDLEDQLMMTALFDNDSDGATDALKSIQLEMDEKAEVRDGKIIVTKTFDNDLEMVYTYGEKPKALQPFYRIKLNDAISENIPFKENDRKDRAYLVKIGDAFKEVKMAATCVKGLLRFNEAENRKDAGLDKAFIKALIIGLCTIKQVKNNDRIHKDLLIFLKELFGIRTSGFDDADGTRYLSFETLVENACKEIRENNYKSTA